MPGHESTGILLSAVFYVLAHRPDVWKKLRDEVIASCPEEPTYDIIKNMTYLRYVLNKTLRLYPPFFSGMQICLKDTVFPFSGGPDGKSPIFIPKDQVIVFDLRALHRDKASWGQDAEEFRSER
ncbi:hypothetical protein MMC14_007976 [Varicellaria rhodocarpa]|nr:hypothetical protein [Varicellaria rhodocarpa]